MTLTPEDPRLNDAAWGGWAGFQTFRAAQGYTADARTTLGISQRCLSGFLDVGGRPDSADDLDAWLRQAYASPDGAGAQRASYVRCWIRYFADCGLVTPYPEPSLDDLRRAQLPWQVDSATASALWTLLRRRPKIRGQRGQVNASSGWSWRNPAATLARAKWRDVEINFSGPRLLGPEGRYRIRLRRHGAPQDQALMLNHPQEQALTVLAGLTLPHGTPLPVPLMVDEQHLVVLVTVIEYAREHHPDRAIFPQLPGQTIPYLGSFVHDVFRVQGFLDHGARTGELPELPEPEPIVIQNVPKPALERRRDRAAAWLFDGAD